MNESCFRLFDEIFGIGSGSEFGFYTDGFLASFNHEGVKFTVASDEGVDFRFKFPSVVHVSQDVHQFIRDCCFASVRHNVP